MSDPTPPNDWLDPVRDFVVPGDTPVRVFFRDDDAGWEDRALVELLDAFADAGAPIDLAAIPTEMRPGLVRELGSRRSERVRVHQHGYRHVNHETFGRKCEFGPSRSLEERRSDLAAGRSDLLAAFGDDLDPIFTPPWNRCVDTIVTDLAELGFTAMSRDLSAGTAGPTDVVELPIALDWFGRYRGARLTPTEFGLRLAALLGSPAVDSVGIMLHHAVTGPAELTRIAELLAVVMQHPGIDCVNMAELLHDPDVLSAAG